MNRNNYEKIYCLTVSNYGAKGRLVIEYENLEALKRLGFILMGVGETRITVRQISRYYLDGVFGKRLMHRQMIERTKILGTLTTDGIK